MLIKYRDVLWTVPHRLLGQIRRQYQVIRVTGSTPVSYRPWSTLVSYSPWSTLVSYRLGSTPVSYCLGSSGEFSSGSPNSEEPVHFRNIKNTFDEP